MRRRRESIQLEIDDDLRLCVQYFANTVEHLQDVKLNKLLYICHLLHYVKHGTLLTKTEFNGSMYGPHVQVLRQLIKEDLDKEILYLKDARTSDDPTYSNPCKILRSDIVINNKISNDSLKTLEAVSKHWGILTYPEVLDFSTRSPLYLSVKYKGKISFEKIILSYPDTLLKNLSVERRKQIHLFVGNKDPDIDILKNKSSSISINEISEIYIASCGGTPKEGIDRKFLGYDFLKIQEVLNNFIQKEKSLLNSVDFSHQIISSNCFGEYSGKVGIYSGILSCYKNNLGYCFNSNNIPENISGDLDTEKIQKIFKLVLN